MNNKFKTKLIIMLIASFFWFIGTYLLWNQKNGKMISLINLVILVLGFISSAVKWNREKQ